MTQRTSKRPILTEEVKTKKGTSRSSKWIEGNDFVNGEYLV